MKFSFDNYNNKENKIAHIIVQSASVFSFVCIGLLLFTQIAIVAPAFGAAAADEADPVDQDPISVNETVPAFNFTLPTFTPPFHLEPEDCFTSDEPDPEQFINGCIKSNGTLTIVDDPADCTLKETPISWMGE